MFTWFFMVAVAAINSVRYVTADCSSELTSFVSCDKEEVDLRIVAANKESELKEVQNKIDDCYKRHNCASPTWAAPVDADLNPLAKILWKNITEDWWGALDNAKRHCVIAEVRGDFGQNLQECVGRKIPGFTISQPSQDSFTLSQDQKEKLKKLAEHRLRIEIADNKCDGGKKWQHLRQCRKKVRDENNNKDSCDVRRKCAASVTPDCQTKWVEKIRTPICQCVTQVADELRKTANTADFKQDVDVKAKCGVELPIINYEQVKSDVDLHQRIKQFVAFHEDRIISFCHTCEGLSM